MTTALSDMCAICGAAATDAVEPLRRTLARGTDPTDSSYSVTVILPDVMLCAAHAEELGQGDRQVGWCDDERCRRYGELDARSACGDPYKKVGPASRS
jgi:hypothetical protein